MFRPLHIPPSPTSRINLHPAWTLSHSPPASCKSPHPPKASNSPRHWCTSQRRVTLCRASRFGQDGDDYFEFDDHGYDSDDYDECVLGGEAMEERRESNELAGACLDVMEGSSKVIWEHSSSAGKTFVKAAGSRLKGGIEVASSHLPHVTGKTAKVFKKTMKKVVGEENVKKIKETCAELPEGWPARVVWLWERPVVKLGRLTMFFARLPALWAIAFAQFGLLAGQVFATVSLPMLPPLLLGAGMLFRSIWVNANFIFPRIYIIAVLLWIIWFANSLVQKTLLYLKRQGTVDAGFATTIITWTECTAILIAGTVILSMLGVNMSGLLLPAGICMALAAKDLSHNFLAGIFLFLVQPFRTGDEVSVRSSTAATTTRGSWFQGTCEKVDLRYTILRQGSARLHVPNSAFITREFLVMDRQGDEKVPGMEDGLVWDSMSGTYIPQGLESWPDADEWQEGETTPYHPGRRTNGTRVAPSYPSTQQTTYSSRVPFDPNVQGNTWPSSTPSSSTPSSSTPNVDAGPASTDEDLEEATHTVSGNGNGNGNGNGSNAGASENLENSESCASDRTDVEVLYLETPEEGPSDSEKKKKNGNGLGKS